MKHFSFFIAILFLWLQLPAQVKDSSRTQTYEYDMQKNRAQKKNYVSIDFGGYLGNANANIASSMTASGFGDKEVANFFGLFQITTQYPKKKSFGTAYLVRAGRFFKPTRALETGFGFSYEGTVHGWDESTGTHLEIKSTIHTLYAAMVFSTLDRTASLGIGPALSIYKASRTVNSGIPKSKNYLLPGAYLAGQLNLSGKWWLAGIRTDLSFSLPATLEAEKFNNTSNGQSATFKETKAGSLNGALSLVAGIRF